MQVLYPNETKGAELMLFSIIIPVYNAENSLDRCICSILEQSWQDWEVILINDGSTDNSGKIIDRFADIDDRIHSVHKQNSGQLLARRSGIEIAKGEYLLFLDSDDFWHPECLSVLEKTIKCVAPDVIMFSAQRVGEARGSQEVICKIAEEQLWLTKEHFYSVLISGFDYNSMCLKAWKKSLFEGDNTDYSAFFGITWGEDRVQLLYPITKAQNIIYIPETLYYYVDNQSSVSRTIKTDRIPMMLSNDAFAQIYSYMKVWDMDNAECREDLAVQYLRNFLSVYYKLRRFCTGKVENKARKRYKWEEYVSKASLRYLFSAKLTCREKLKLILAWYFRI